MNTNQLPMCDFNKVEQLPDGQYRHTARCGMVRIAPIPDEYHKRCDGTCVVGCQRRPPALPGFTLLNMLHRLGFSARANCGCMAYATQMNAWGADGCRERRAEIIAHTRTQYRMQTTGQIMRAAAKAIASGLAFKLNPLDPFGSLVDEAIRLSEQSPPDQPG